MTDPIDAPFKGLSRHQLLELVAVAVALQQGETPDVGYDVLLPVKATGELRQVDLVLWHPLPPGTALEIVAVQARSANEFTGKAAALGAQRVTLVNTAGLTRGAVSRVLASKGALAAHQIREPIDGELPTNFKPEGMYLDLAFEGETTRTWLSPQIHADAATGTPLLTVSFGNLDATGSAGALVIFAPPRDALPPGADLPMSSWIVPAEGDPYEVKMAVEYAMPDGEVRISRPATSRTGRVLKRRANL